MNPRTASILEAVIREHIATGRPVSSKELCAKCDFGVRAATIRNELNELVSEDYLTQPHTSSGRVPTDKGYRFFVERIFENFGGETRSARDRRNVVSVLAAEFARRDFENLIDDLSDKLDLLGVGYAANEESVYKSGFGDLMGQFVNDFWFGDPRETVQIARDFESLDERVNELAGSLGGGAPRVFIGRSPITKSPELSVIAESFMVGDDHFVIAAVGPKRMDYERAIGLFLNLKESIEKHG